MESIDTFTNFMLEIAAAAKPKKREGILEVIKGVRPFFDEFIAKLISDE